MLPARHDDDDFEDVMGTGVFSVIGLMSRVFASGPGDLGSIAS